MRLLGIDFETQDDDAKTTRITEAGAVLIRLDRSNDGQIVYDLEDKFNSLCWESDYPAQRADIVELTGITDEMLQKEGKPRRETLERLYVMMDHADVIVAHKVNFDKTVLDFTARAIGMPAPPTKEWLCTLTNFPWPKKYTCRKLSHLAYDHSILVDPVNLHRAINDVALMLQLITTKYDIDQVLAYARDPWVYLRAFPIEPWKDGEVQVSLVKKHEFGWQRIKYDDREFPKQWVKRVKTKDLRAELSVLELLPFRVNVIEGL
jgi:DNA polymerase III epsilon subunit-like protein